MIQAQAIVERVRRISPALQRIDIAVERGQRQISPGQFFLARVTETLDPYLREPWIPIRHEGTTLTVERPITQMLTPGQVVNLIGPLGKTLPLRETARTLLLISKESAPHALLMLAERALARGIGVVLVLLGRAAYYPLDVLPQEIEVVRSTEDTWATQTETLKWADQIVVVAPPPYDVPFYTALLDGVRKLRMDVPAGYVYGMMQPPMPCGIGVCGACLVRVRKDDVPTCIEGPAFDMLDLPEVQLTAR